MTTANSPLDEIKARADRMAAGLKAAERGETLTGKIAAARMRESITVGIAMNDRLVSIEMTWAMIRETSEAGISEYIVAQMRGHPKMAAEGDKQIITYYLGETDDGEFFIEIEVDGKLHKTIGPFDTESEAARALEDLVQMMESDGAITIPNVTN